MPPGLIVRSLVRLPVKLVFWTETLATVVNAGLSNAAVMMLVHDAASACGVPPAIIMAVSDDAASHAWRRPPRDFITQHPSPVRFLSPAPACPGRSVANIRCAGDRRPPAHRIPPLGHLKLTHSD